MRSDIGGEFADEYHAYLLAENTRHDFSLENNPSSNSRIEGVVRRICKGTRYSLYQAGALYILWAHAWVVWCKSWSCTKVNRWGKVPYRHLYGRDPPELLPFGVRVLFLAPDMKEPSGKLGERRKFDPRAREGVALGYAPLRAIIVMDIAHLRADKEYRLIVTRDYRAWPGEFPLKEMQLERQGLEVVLYRLCDPRHRRGAADALSDGTGSCFICGLIVTMDIVSCPACRGKHREHRRNGTCAMARCQGHDRDEAMQEARVAGSCGRSRSWRRSPPASCRTGTVSLLRRM